jgi:3-hydroxy-3-methylglutaryl CoA synthase
MVSIGGYGGYVPLYRIERSTIAEQHGDYPSGGETTVPSHDEDHITMGVKAAKEALSHADVDGSSLDVVYVASVSDPFDEHGLAPPVGYAVGADQDVRVADFDGLARSATTAIQAAADAIEAGSAETALVVGSDVLTAPAGSAVERTAGAGAAAIVLQEQNGTVATIEGITNATTGFVGRFAVRDQGPVEGDSSFNRDVGYLDAVPAAIEALAERGHTVEPDRAALPAEDSSWGDRALAATDLDAERHGTFDAVGYVGAAGVLLDAVAALEAASPGEQLLVAAYGPGGSDALLLETSTGIETLPETTLQEYVDSKEYVTYAKHRAYRTQVGGDA